MSEKTITDNEYWNTIRELAKEVIEEVEIPENPLEEERGEIEEKIEEVLHSTIDSHEWVIYTAYNFDVLKHSKNSGYALMEFGIGGVLTDDRRAIRFDAMAFWAMYQDVMEEIQEILDGLTWYEMWEARDMYEELVVKEMLSDPKIQAELAHLENDAEKEEAIRERDDFDEKVEEYMDQFSRVQ